MNVPTQDHQLNGIMQDKRTKKELIDYLHGCAFSPVASTWIRAIKKGHFEGWPGLSEELVKKHLSPSINTVMGHMKSKKRRTTKPESQQEPQNDRLLPDFEPVCEEETLDLFATMWDTEKKTYSDQTGKFPIESTRGNKYIFILYSYDTNAILAEPLKSRQARNITEAWVTCYKKLQKAGYAPRLHVLDKEFSAIMNNAFDKHNVKHQTVAP